MNQPGFGGHRLWRRSNVEVAGIMIGGNCVVVLLFFGFGLLLIGTLSTVTSSAFDSKPSDPPFFRDSTNIPRLIGKIFLGIGGAVFGVGLILLVIVVRKAREQARNNQGPAGTNVVVAGSTYPGSTQPHYPTQQNAQSQPYSYNIGQAYPPASGQGQSYQPVISGQGQSYQPVISGQGQPYLQGPGQPYTGPGQPYVQGSGQPYGGQVQPYPQGSGQPYPPVSGQEQHYLPGSGQSYPPAKQDQHYPSTGSGYPHPLGDQPYPPTDGNAEKSTDPSQLTYNPGHPYQTHPSGYPGSGQPQTDVPPPPYR